MAGQRASRLTHVVEVDRPGAGAGRRGRWGRWPRPSAPTRIVDVLAEGSGVVTTRADVHYVVTEHGIARLFGKSLRERAQELIAVAHPDFRSEFKDAARKRGLV